MAFLIWIIFGSNQNIFSFKAIRYKLNIVIAFAWMILPVVGLSGYWDRFFSSSVYSGNNLHLLIYPKDIAFVPSELKSHLIYSKQAYQGLHYYINTSDWCLSELQVPVPPERRIYAVIEKEVEEKYGRMQPVFRYK